MMRHGRFAAIAAAAVSAVAATEQCPDGVCRAQGDEESALLQTPINRHSHFLAANSTAETSYDFWCPCANVGDIPDGASKASKRDGPPGQAAEEAALKIGPGDPIVWERVLRELHRAFNNIGTREAPGGVLSHGFDNVEEILERPLTSGEGLPSFRDVTDCAANNRFTCSAFALARRDIAPIAFNFPSAGIRISVLLDANKAWSLTTGAAPTDKDTNTRSACSQNNAGEPPPVFDVSKHECLKEVADAAGVTSNDVLFQPNSDTGTPAATPNCAPDDFRCKLVTSGGCLDHIFFLDLDFCTDSTNALFKNFETCFSIAECAAPELEPGADFPTPGPGGKYFCLYFSGACSPCTNPFVCALETPATPGNPEITFNPNPAGLGPQFQAAVGTDGSKWAEQYYDILLQPSQASFQQCGFNSKQTPELVNALHSLYKKAIDESGGTPKDRATPAATAPFKLFGDPDNVVFLENEINCYVQSNTITPEFREQDKIFFDSIIALGIDTRTCEEMLAFVDNPFYDIPAGTAKPGSPEFKGAKERCDVYLGTTDRTKEQEDIRKVKLQIRRLQGRFSAKAGRRIPVVEANFGANVATDLDTFAQALKGEVDPAKFFKRYPSF